MIVVIAGKGGVGKTAISALLVRRLSDLKKADILAIDADPNSNLNFLLGLDYEFSLADLREELNRPLSQPGVSKLEYLSFRFQDAILEADDFDLLVMGRPEGPGCYCAVNNLLRDAIARLSKSYSYVIIDSEAGMEHLSRRTTGQIDLLFLVAEPTRAALQAIVRSREIARNLNFKVKNVVYIINKLRAELSPELKNFLDSNQINSYYALPFSEELSFLSESQKTIYDFNDRKYLEGIDIIVERELLRNSRGE